MHRAASRRDHGNVRRVGWSNNIRTGHYALPFLAASHPGNPGTVFQNRQDDRPPVSCMMPVAGAMSSANPVAMPQYQPTMRPPNC